MYGSRGHSPFRHHSVKESLRKNKITGFLSVTIKEQKILMCGLDCKKAPKVALELYQTWASAFIPDREKVDQKAEKGARILQEMQQKAQERENLAKLP